MTYTEIGIEELRKMANGTSNRDVRVQAVRIGRAWGVRLAPSRLPPWTGIEELP